MEQTFTVDAARDHDVVEGKGTGVRAALDAFLLSANIACAVMYAACLYVARNLTTETARDDSAYYFLRGVVRVAELFHRNASTPVVTSAVGRK